MSKKLAAFKRTKKVAEVKYGNYLRVHIPAGKASAAPPLGPQLGQHSVNVAQFCKEFNQRTENIKTGVRIPCAIKINPDRTYNLTIHTPYLTYFLFSACGIVRGAMKPTKENAGLISLKHIYEIAKAKASDPYLVGWELEEICKMLINSCKRIGIKIVPDYTVEELTEFLQERDKIVEQQLKEIQDKKQAKLLRTIT